AFPGVTRCSRRAVARTWRPRRTASKCASGRIEALVMASSHRKRKASAAQARWHIDGTERTLMRLRYLSALALVTACGGHIKRDTIGRAGAVVHTRGAGAVDSASTATSGMMLSP